MKKCSYLWFGGSSYAPPAMGDLQRFDSIASMKEVFENCVGDPYTPLVSKVPQEEGGPSALVYFDHSPNEETYPDAVLCFGPRGGLKLCPA